MGSKFGCKSSWSNGEIYSNLTSWNEHWKYIKLLLKGGYFPACLKREAKWVTQVLLSTLKDLKAKKMNAIQRNLLFLLYKLFPLQRDCIHPRNCLTCLAALHERKRANTSRSVGSSNGSTGKEWETWNALAVQHSIITMWTISPPSLYACISRAEKLLL